MYFIISANDDGEVSVASIVHKDDVIDYLGLNNLEEIKEEYWPHFFTGPPEDVDPNYWESNTLLIKGEIIVPRIKEIVKKYVIE